MPFGDGKILGQSEKGILYEFRIPSDMNCVGLSFRKDPCLSFVKQYAQATHPSIDEQIVATLARGVLKSDPDAIEILWQWTEKTGVTDEMTSDEEYIMFISNHLFGKELPDMKEWTLALKNGKMTKKDLFQSIITSHDFLANHLD